MKDRWRELITDNPMLVEIARFRRRFLSVGGSSAMGGLVLAIVAMLYLGLLMLVFGSRGDIDPMAIVMFQTVIYILVIPGMVYASIAGEREKRTLDLLMVAPLSTEQIVMGKFLGAMSGIGVGVGAFLVPILICLLTFPSTDMLHFVMSELVSCSFVVMLAAMTLFFSARSRRALTALGLTLGVLTMSLLVGPMLAVSLFDVQTDSIFVAYHPLFVISNLMQRSTSFAPSSYNALIWGLPQTIGYLVLAAVFLLWASRTLRFADNDATFSLKGHHA